MADRDKVINGLELCRYDPDPGQPLKSEVSCDICPYWSDEYGCRMGELLNDAIVLLKAQEPRVMALEEMREGEVYWFDYLRNFLLCPVIFNMYDRGDSSYLNFVWQYGNSSWKICEYGRTWRCWTARPTQEQREATPWE